MDPNMELILKNLNRLIPLINCNFLCDLIAYREVLTPPDWDEICSQEDITAKTESLLLAIARNGPNAMRAFREILMLTENTRAIEILNSGSRETQDNRCSFSESTQGSSTIPRATSSRLLLSRDGFRPTHTRSYSSCDDSDHGLSTSSSSAINDPLANGRVFQSPTGTVSIKPEHQFIVKTNGIMRQGANIYPSKSTPRGFCIIINNVDFQIFEQRASAEEDGAFLSSIFKQLGFQMNYFKNLSAGDIEAVFQKYSQMDDLKNHDALVVIIMSHGLKCDLIVGSDGLYVRLDTLLAYFNNFNCPHLMGKPKLFFIQACRGDEYDFGIRDETTTADAGPIPGPVIFTKEVASDRIPTWSDMCIVQSTIHGYVALRSVQSGSWFAEALGWTLIDHASNMSLHELLMVVSSKLSKREGKKSVKQAIEVIWRGWNKTFYFNPGISDKSNNQQSTPTTKSTQPLQSTKSTPS